MYGSEYFYVAYYWSNFDSIDGEREGQDTKSSVGCICSGRMFQMCDDDEEFMPEVDSSEEVHNSGPSLDDVDMCAFRNFIANSLMADRG